jgi:hypothetical protein
LPQRKLVPCAAAQFVTRAGRSAIANSSQGLWVRFGLVAVIDFGVSPPKSAKSVAALPQVRLEPMLWKNTRSRAQK